MGKSNARFVTFAKNKHVGELGVKAVAIGIVHETRIRTRVSLSVG